MRRPTSLRRLGGGLGVRYTQRVGGMRKPSKMVFAPALVCTANSWWIKTAPRSPPRPPFPSPFRDIPQQLRVWQFLRVSLVIFKRPSSNVSCTASDTHTPLIRIPTAVSLPTTPSPSASLKPGTASGMESLALLAPLAMVGGSIQKYRSSRVV